MVTGVAGVGKVSMCVEATKTYLHHVGNFLFLSNSVPNVVLFVSVWRSAHLFVVDANHVLTTKIIFVNLRTAK